MGIIATVHNPTSTHTATSLAKHATPAGHGAFIQPKLTVGNKDDIYEKEADRMADKVVSDSRKTEVQPFIQPKCNACEEELQKKEEEGTDEFETPEVQLFSEQAIPPGDSAEHIESQLSNTKGQGTPLQEDVAHEMGNAFGYDFSNVRVHAGSAAIQMNQELNAKAFTNGNDIYFNQGQYQTSSTEGKKLLAHELTHVVQQKGDHMIQKQDEVDGSTLTENAQGVDYSDVDTVVSDIESELQIPREGWTGRIRWHGELRDRTIGALRAGRIFIYGLLQAMTERRSQVFARQLNRLIENSQATDPALVLAIAWREGGSNIFPGRGTVNSLTSGGLDNLFHLQETPSQRVAARAILSGIITTGQQLLDSRAQLEARMREQGAEEINDETVAEFQEDIENLIATARRYRRGGGELRQGGFLPDDFPALGLARMSTSTIFTPSERGRLQMPAMLPTDRAIEAYGAVIALARDRFLNYAEQVSWQTRTQIEENMSTRAMRFWTMLFFGGTGWGQQMINWWIRNGGDIFMIPHALPRGRRLDRNIPDDMPGSGLTLIARGLVTVMEAEALDRILFPEEEAPAQQQTQTIRQDDQEQPARNLGRQLSDPVLTEGPTGLATPRNSSEESGRNLSSPR